MNSNTDLAVIFTEVADLGMQQMLFYNLLCQLDKDFGMSGIETDFVSKATPETLYSLVFGVLKSENTKNNGVDIPNLLYRIDVSEKTLRKMPLLTTDQIVKEVLKREMQKVYLKYQFSNK